MKIKKKILIGVIIVICIVLIGAIWSIKDRTLKSAVQNSNEVSAGKDKIKNDKSVQSRDNKTSLQPQNKSKNEGQNKSETKSNMEPKHQDMHQGQFETKSNIESKSQTKSQVVGVKISNTQKTKENNSKNSTPKIQNFEGYVTSEDDFAAGLKEDTADMIYMRLMALSGLGITFQQDGKWFFYYFDGTFSTDNKKGSDGKWAFDGTDSQLSAWQLVEQKVKSGKGKSPVPVKITGVLNGNTKTNLGPDADGRKFSVITVKSIIEK